MWSGGGALVEELADGGDSVGGTGRVDALGVGQRRYEVAQPGGLGGGGEGFWRCAHCRELGNCRGCLEAALDIDPDIAPHKSTCLSVAGNDVQRLATKGQLGAGSWALEID